MPRRYSFPIQVLFILVAAGATAGCAALGWAQPLDIVTKIFFGGVFFVFAITLGTANRRRFEAIDAFAALRAQFLSARAFLAEFVDKKTAGEVEVRAADFFQKLRDRLARPGAPIGETAREDFARWANLAEKSGVAPPVSTRLLQMQILASDAIERLRAIRDHRTPRILTRSLDAALLAGVLLVVPELAGLGVVVGTAGAAGIAGLVTALIRAQFTLEFPFDRDPDDARAEDFWEIK